MAKINDKKVKVVGPSYPVKIKLDGGIMPKKESAQAAGYDLYCPKDTTIHFGRQVIPLKFSIEMWNNFMADIRPRSGHQLNGFKVMYRDNFDGEEHVTRIDADVLLGTIDADYRDDVGVILNVRDKCVFMSDRYYIPEGWSIAQMVFSIIPFTHFEAVDELDMTDDRGGGYGHSDEEHE